MTCYSNEACINLALFDTPAQRDISAIVLNFVLIEFITTGCPKKKYPLLKSGLLL